ANNADVKPGDLLVTSGLDGRYPTGFPVAVITQVRRDPAEPFAAVTAQPVADMDHGHDVLLYFPAVTPPSVPKPETRTTKKPAREKPSKKKPR
ncbi:MAG: rod shape-determining protein MreC, partial [Gammaproteobacteria bacterium]